MIRELAGTNSAITLTCCGAQCNTFWPHSQGEAFSEIDPETSTTLDTASLTYVKAIFAKVSGPKSGPG